MTDGAGPFGYSDAARRMSDVVTNAIADGQGGRWMAFALEDGASNGTTYDTKAEAIHAHRNAARKHCYLRVPLDLLPPKGAEAFLRVHRQLAALGQHPDDEMINHEFMIDNRLEAYPTVDKRRLIATQFDRAGRPVRRSPGGLILP